MCLALFLGCLLLLHLCHVCRIRPPLKSSISSNHLQGSGARGDYLRAWFGIMSLRSKYHLETLTVVS
uniref:Secreted protein n=1 Tax=Anguilla anguilla TaxID=7936 RepID=A0A0E9SW09_ANGAN